MSGARPLRWAAASSLVAAVAGGALLTAPRAEAAATHVAVVIAGQGSYCVPWHSGMSGGDVLNAAADVTWGQHQPYLGFVLGINGVQPKPSSEYWSYWHSDGRGWSYSNYGATSTEPDPGTVEGWSLSPTDQKLAPPPASYAAICAGADAPPPAPPPPTRAAQPAPILPTVPRLAPPAAPPAAPRPSGMTVPPPPGYGTSANGPSASPVGSTPKRARSGAGTTSARSAATSPVSSSPAVVEMSSSPAGASNRSAGSALPMLVGGVAVLAVGGAGGAIAWRRRVR